MDFVICAENKSVASVRGQDILDASMRTTSGNELSITLRNGGSGRTRLGSVAELFGTGQIYRD